MEVKYCQKNNSLRRISSWQESQMARQNVHISTRYIIASPLGK